MHLVTSMAEPTKHHPDPSDIHAPQGSARTPGQRAGLTHGGIVAAALRVAERKGLEEVSMRRVAAELGVAPNALYTYFPDKTALLDALFDALLGELNPPEPVAGRWQESLAELMRASRRLVLAHPHLATLFLTRPGGPNALRLGEAALRILKEGGVTGGSAVVALRALLTYTLGFAAMELARTMRPERRERSERTRSLIDGLDPVVFALTRELGAELATHPGDADFEAGLGWLIRGIAAE